jgi:hypothetical protein
MFIISHDLLKEIFDEPWLEICKVKTAVIARVKLIT